MAEPTDTESDTPSDAPTTPARPKRARAKQHASLGLGVILRLAVAGLIIGYGALALSGRALPLPEWSRASLEQSMAAMIPEGRFSLGGAEVTVGRDWVPRVSLKNIRVGDAAGGGVAELNSLRTRLSPAALLRGEFGASRITLSGAQITLRRNADGSFAMQAGAPSGQGVGFGALLEGVDRALRAEALVDIERVSANSVVLTLEDARTGRIWQASNANLELRRREDGLTISLTSDVFNGTDDLARVQVSLGFSQATRATTIGASVTNAAARDIAVQAPALAWLEVLDAPISGAVRAVLEGDGSLQSFAGTLDLGAGALQPNAAADPLEFDTARAYFGFDPDRQRIEFSEVAMTSEFGRIAASGRMYLSEVQNGWPAAYLGQFTVSEVAFDGAGIFEGPVALQDLSADMRLRLNPFTVDLPQIVTVKDGEPVRASARVTAEEDGWHLAIDAETDRIAPKTVLDFWPLDEAPGTRSWLSRNVLAGALTDLTATVRAQQGEKPDIALAFDFEEATVKFMRSLPPAEQGRGRATLMARRFDLIVEEGAVTAGNGDVLSGAGTHFAVPDTRKKPAPGEVTVRAAGPLPGVMTLLNNPPFRVLDRAGRDDLIGTGRAEIAAKVSLPLIKGIKTEDVDYAVSATVRDFRSDTLIGERVLTSREMKVATTPEGIRVHGPAALDGVALTADWRQPFGAEAKAQGSTTTGSITLSQAALDAFDIPLPAGLVNGSGDAEYTLRMKEGDRPELVLSSDLAGIGLSLPTLGWGLSQGATGRFDLTARLAETPEVTAMSLDAPGLSFDGNIDLGPGGAFVGATFAPLQVGTWLNANARLSPGGAIALTGGRFDLRQFSRLDRSGGSGTGGPIEVRLDRMTVTDSITLSPMTGRFRPMNGGLDGDFEARVNGQTPVIGTLVPSNGGTAVRLRANNAGGVIRDAGLSPNAEGGTLDLVMNPVRGAPGNYDGEFLIEGIRVRKAPAMADLLDAISVVGLLDQLDGPGIRFDEVDGRFRLTPRTLQVRQAAAVGGSLGVSLDGTYDLGAKTLNMQGVISPVYFLNGIGSIFTRRGEGLFGFNYRLAGTAANPDVSVNPLSILTPGMFRSIFRRDAPTQ